MKPHVSGNTKHQTVSVESTFNLPRILNELALEQIANQEAEEVAYLRVWEVYPESDTGAS